MAHAPLSAATLLGEELPRIARAAAARPALDLACGRGRNALALAAAGVRVVGIDRDATALTELGTRASALGRAVARVRADVETPHGLPFASGVFGAVLVFRFLFRPLVPEILRVLAPGGSLVYETFTTAQSDLGGGPRRREFLLAPGELSGLFPVLRVLRSEEGVFAEPQPVALARLVAEKPR
jgi:SAM-dependent methyltransferase